MKKKIFLNSLRARLKGLPEEDIRRTLEYYSEMIDDRMEDGLSEDRAVRAAGDPSEIANRIISEMPMKSVVKTRMNKGKLGGVGIALIIIGSPLWIALLAVAFSLFITFYAVLWSLVVAAIAINVSLWASGLALPLCAAVYGFSGHVGGCVLILGASLILIGVSILLTGAVGALVKGAARLSRYPLVWVKRMMIGR